MATQRYVYRANIGGTVFFIINHREEYGYGVRIAVVKLE